LTRRAEASLLALSTVIVAAGTAAVAATLGRGIAADTAGAAAAHAAAFGAMLVAIRLWAPTATRLLLPPVALIVAIGCVEVYRIDQDLGRLQRWWLLVGAAVGAAALRVLHRRGLEILRRYRYLFLAAALVMLLLPLTPSTWPIGGAEVGGSRLWLRLSVGDRTVSFQPGEVVKLLIVAFLASYLADRWQALSAMPRTLGPLRLPEPRQLLPIILAFVVAVLVLIYQLDLGASLHLFVVFVVMLFVGTGRPTYLIAGGFLAVGGAYAAAASFSHVGTRVDSWLRPFDDYAGVGYQAAQALFSLGNGGILGAGLGGGAPYSIPAAATDYVFVAIVEEIGLAGGLALLAAFAVLIAVGFGIALRSTDRFRTLLAAGLTITLAAQTIIILAGVLRMLPLTGITLPFTSYGGSSLLANFALVALLARVSHEERT
jgi:cell division protein FtsW (lipid II flippase)